MTDQKQEARTLTLGERMVFAARLAVEEHLRQSVTAVPRDSSYFNLTDFHDSSYPEVVEAYGDQIINWEELTPALRGAA